MKSHLIVSNSTSAEEKMLRNKDSTWGKVYRLNELDGDDGWVSLWHCSWVFQQCSWFAMVSLQYIHQEPFDSEREGSREIWLQVFHLAVANSCLSSLWCEKDRVLATIGCHGHHCDWKDQFGYYIFCIESSTRMIFAGKTVYFPNYVKTNCTVFKWPSNFDSCSSSTLKTILCASHLLTVTWSCQKQYLMDFDDVICYKLKPRTSLSYFFKEASSSLTVCQSIIRKTYQPCYVWYMSSVLHWTSGSPQNGIINATMCMPSYVIRIWILNHNVLMTWENLMYIGILVKFCWHPIPILSMAIQTKINSLSNPLSPNKNTLWKTSGPPESINTFIDVLVLVASSLSSSVP